MPRKKQALEAPPDARPADKLEEKAERVARLWAEVKALRSQQTKIASLQAHSALRAELLERLRQLKELGEEL